MALDTRYGGWYFATAESVVRRWASANGCAGALDAPPRAAACDGSRACAVGVAGGAACVGFREGCAEGAVVLQCTHPGGHEVPAWAPKAVTAFMFQHPRRASLPLADPHSAEASGHALLLVALLALSASALAAALFCCRDGPACARRFARRARLGPLIPRPLAASERSIACVHATQANAR